MKTLFTLLAALLIATDAFAHEASKGPNGGAQVDAGSYHVEIVARDTALIVYLHDEKEKPVDTKGYKATGIFVIDGKPQRIELKADTRQQADRHFFGSSANHTQGRRPDHVAHGENRTGQVRVTLFHSLRTKRREAAKTGLNLVLASALSWRGLPSLA